MLTIIFGVSWHHGAEYFMQKLVDGDVAINHWQWQMQAGVTNPLSDTFRIYNPTTNLKERDSKLQYIHEWLPEYADCQTVDDVLNQAQPIVDWSYERRTRGGYISHLRRLVRERLQREGGAELYQAQLMLRTTTRIAEQYKQSATSPPTRTACSAHQLSLFEHGDA
jgi:deoxyribodipyrimidine photo-lyase